MGSKLENYEAFILEELAKGRSYATIAAALEKMGLKTSAQNIHAWAARRASKVLSRQYLVNPIANPRADVLGQEEEGVDLEEAAAVAAAAAPTSKPLQAPVVTPPLPVLGRSASISKQEPTEVEKKMTELAQLASNPSPLGWKK